VLVAAAILAAVLIRPHRHPAPAPISMAPEPAAPAAALPVAAWGPSARGRLERELRDAFAPALAGASRWSLAVVAGDGKLLYDERAGRAVVPASVQKLVIAASSLDSLGPGYRYHTILAARDGISDGGLLEGNLWLIGSGDTSLQSDDLRAGAGTLARAGLRRIGGGVVVDATALRGPGLNRHWAPDDDGQDYAAPVSAISVDEDTVETHAVVGGVEQTFWAPMQDVARDVALLMQGILARRGIVAAMPPAVAAAPLDTVVLWDHRSAPLKALIAHMLFVSDNHYAEQLLRTLGEEVTGVSDYTGGLAAERAFLERTGVPTPGLRLYDGSGLSPDNRVAAITLARLLAAAEPSLYPLLPLGGRQGTLADYDFTTALGRVRAKTGHLSGVSALAGYVTTMHSGRVAFAFVIDGSPGNPDAAIVRAADRLAAF